jgi:hypothetical protein
MKNKKYIFEGFIAGFFIGLTALWLFEENKRRKQRIQELQNHLNEGYLIDRMNIQNDWNNIRGDINNAHEELIKN